MSDEPKNEQKTSWLFKPLDEESTEQEVRAWWERRRIVYNILTILYLIVFIVINLEIMRYLAGRSLFLQLRGTPIFGIGIFLLILNFIYWKKGKDIKEAANAPTAFKTMLQETALLCAILVLLPFLPAHFWGFLSVPQNQWGRDYTFPSILNNQTTIQPGSVR